MSISSFNHVSLAPFPVIVLGDYDFISSSLLTVCISQLCELLPVMYRATVCAIII